MDIVKLSTDWAKAEVFSAKIVWLFSAIEIMTALGFWYLGRTAMAKAFVWPLLLTGLFLLSVGAGLYLANKPRIERFEKESHHDPGAVIILLPAFPSRAIAVAIIITASFLMIVDTNTEARNTAYHDQLLTLK